MEPVFIGGYLRTGTTLLQTLLCSSPDTNAMVREVVFLRGLLENYVHSLKLFDEHVCDYFDDRIALTRYCSEQVQHFLKHTHIRLGTPRCMVLKHPHLTPFFPLMQLLLPQARFIVMVRDPRDVLASAIRAQRKGAGEFGNSTPAEIAHGIRSYYDACLDSSRTRFTQRTRYIRYEDLVRVPILTLQLLAEFLDIDMSGFSIQAAPASGHIDWNSTQQKNRALHTSLYGAAVSNERVGRYPDTLTDDEISTATRICAPLIERFDYPSA